MLGRKRQPIIKTQKPWLIVSYSNIQNKGEDDEFDPGYIQFIHKETNKEFLKEMSWLLGEGPYGFDGYRTPTLIDIWNILTKYTPATTGFVYKNWDVNRRSGCFMYTLFDFSKHPPEEIHKNIIGDAVSKEHHDFAAFLEMLDNISDSIEASKPKRIILDLEEARKKREAIG